MTLIRLTVRLEDSGSSTEPIVNAGWTYRVRNSVDYVDSNGDLVAAAWPAGGGWKAFRGAAVTIDLDPRPPDEPYLAEIRGPIDPSAAVRKPTFRQEYRTVLADTPNNTSWYALDRVTGPGPDGQEYPIGGYDQLVTQIAALQAQIDGLVVGGGGASNLAGITDMSVKARTFNTLTTSAAMRGEISAAPAGTRVSPAGAVGVSDLGITGTATGAKFLRDDGSWQTPSGVVAGSVAWDDVTSKPSTFPPATHTHTDLSDAITALGADVAAVEADAAAKAALIAKINGAMTWIDGTAFDLTGAGDSTSAAQAVLTAATDGQVLVWPRGTIRAAGLNYSAKSLTHVMWGTKWVQHANNTILTVTGAWGTPIAVSSIANTDTADAGGSWPHAVLTMASAPGWVRGDVIKVYSDDIIPEARAGSGGLEQRKGEFASVQAVSGSTVTLSGPLRDTYATTIRAAKMADHTVTILGWQSETPTSGITAEWTTGQITLASLKNPTITDARINRGGGHGIRFTSCWRYTVSATIRNLENDAANGQFGYGIYNVGSEGGDVDIVVEAVRHGYTDNASTIATATSDPTGYGRPRGDTVRVTGTTPESAPADTHGAGEGHTFHVNVWGCPVGVQLRGRKHRVISPKIRATKCIWVFDEPDETHAMTWGHEVINPDLYGALGIHVECYAKGSIDQVTVRGGEIWGTEQPVLLDRGNIRFAGAPTTVGFAEATTLGRKVIEATAGRIRLDTSVTLDLRAAGGVDADPDLSPVHLHDVDCRLTGDRGNTLRILSAGVQARVPMGVRGQNGSLPIIQVDMWTDRPWSTGPFDYATTSSWATYRVENGGPGPEMRWSWVGSAFVSSPAVASDFTAGVAVLSTSSVTVAPCFVISTTDPNTPRPALPSGAVALWDVPGSTPPVNMGFADIWLGA